jgi:hypothetical protein
MLLVLEFALRVSELNNQVLYYLSHGLSLLFLSFSNKFLCLLPGPSVAGTLLLLLPS